MPSEANDFYSYYYAVTCHHVAVHNKHDVYSCIRFNTFDGRTDCIQLDPHDWEFDPRYGDVAAQMISPVDNFHDASALHINTFLSQIDVTRSEIGVGEDVFMIGLFIDPENEMHKKRNNPMARFGHISSMPNPSVPLGGGLYGPREYFVLDLHSRTGYSGSPAFVFRVFSSDLTISGGRDLPWLSGDNIFKVLGMHCAQFPEHWEAKGLDGSPGAEVAEQLGIGRDLRVRGLSGMTMAVPAWEIAGLLRSEKFDRERRRLDTARYAAPAVLERHESGDGGPSAPP